MSVFVQFMKLQDDGEMRVRYLLTACLRRTQGIQKFLMNFETSVRSHTLGSYLPWCYAADSVEKRITCVLSGARSKV